MAFVGTLDLVGVKELLFRKADSSVDIAVSKAPGILRLPAFPVETDTVQGRRNGHVLVGSRKLGIPLGSRVGVETRHES